MNKQGGVKQMMKRIISLLLCLAIASVSLVPAASAQTQTESQTKKFIITNPYEQVDWDSWGTYKAQLHCHTNASDGYLTIHEFVQKHYDLDYDIVALTDHGTINRGWNNEPQLVPILRFIKRERTQMADIIPLTEEEYSSYLNGTAASDSRTHQNGMLDVPLGIELNMATPVADCHLTGYFAEYGQGLAGVYGDYETPSKGVRKKGGISMLSHVGEFVYPDKDSADHVGQPVDEYYSNKFARIFLDNAGSSVGMGINSATDAHTRCDRILYDSILQRTIPNGVVPWGFTFSDSHNERSLNDAYTMMLMENFTMEDFRSSMENGLCFGVSHYSNGVELNGMKEMPNLTEEEIEENKLYLSNDTPMVTHVTVDAQSETISIEGEHFNEITWVSNGNVIKRESNITTGSAALYLHDPDLLSDPSLYVRFYITGENGICYSQPFVLNVEGETFEPVNVPKTHDVSTFLRALVTVLDVAFFRLNPIVWAFKYFALGYNPLENLCDPY